MSAPLLKDRINPEGIAQLAHAFGAAAQARSSTFHVDAFVAASVDGLSALELRARVDHVIAALSAHLPPRFEDAAALVRDAATRMRTEPRYENWRGLIAWPLIDWVARGTQADVPHMAPETVAVALETLAHVTMLFSAEFAIRPYITHHPTLVFPALRAWVTHEDEHVRRLVSEGTRPRLPWAGRLAGIQADPTLCAALLDALVDDPSEYVRRSVANHVNDISKDHPAHARAACAAWLAEDVDAACKKQRRRVAHHALRTQIKAGDVETLRILGYTTDPLVTGTLDVTPGEAHVGEHIMLHGRVESTSDMPQRVVVDAIVHYVKANGSTAPKVFKLKNLELPAGGHATVKKKLSLRPMSTRTHHPGEHRVELVVSGQVIAHATFTLHA